jgi:hypothetical protein
MSRKRLMSRLIQILRLTRIHLQIQLIRMPPEMREAKATEVILAVNPVEKKAVSPAVKTLPERERKEAAAKWRSISAQYPFIRILSFP